MKCVRTHALHQIRYRFSKLYLVEFLFYEYGDTKFQTHDLNTVVCWKGLVVSEQHDFLNGMFYLLWKGPYVKQASQASHHMESSCASDW